MCTEVYTSEVVGYSGPMPKKKKSRPFIVIEALDAGGSQTQSNRLVKRLKKEGYKPLQLHFPHEDRATGRLIYDKFLLSHNAPKFSRREQALLYIQDFFSRKEDIERVLQNGKKSLVVSDRFYTSTLAYQTLGLTGLARDSMLEWLRGLIAGEEPALPKPTVVIFLDTPPGVSMGHLRTKNKDYFENLNKLRAIRNSYLKIAQEEKWITVNSMTPKGTQRPIADIHAEIWRHIKPLL